MKNSTIPRLLARTVFFVMFLSACLAGFLSGGIPSAYAAGLTPQHGPAPQYILCSSTYYRNTEQVSMTHTMDGGTFTFKARLWSKVDTYYSSHYCGVSYAQGVVSVPSGGKINRVTIGDDFANKEVSRTNVGPGTLVIPTTKTTEPHGNADLVVLGIDGYSNMNEYLITNTWP